MFNIEIMCFFRSRKDGTTKPCLYKGSDTDTHCQGAALPFTNHCSNRILLKLLLILTNLLCLHFVQSLLLVNKVLSIVGDCFLPQSSQLSFEQELHEAIFCFYYKHTVALDP